MGVRAVSAVGLEDAIALVEDEIARVRPAACETLETGDAEIRSLAYGSDVIAIEAVEQDFQRLAARGIPSDKRAAAKLLILRELMHHLQVKAIRLV